MASCKLKEAMHLLSPPPADFGCSQARADSRVVIVLCRCTPPNQAWLIFEDDATSPPVRWAAPPDVDGELRRRLDGDLAGRFEARWIERDGAPVLSLGARLALPDK